MAGETTPLVNGKVDDNLKRLKAYQWYAFFVTFGGYFMAHFSRKSYSTIKQQLRQQGGFSRAFESQMDSVFMGTYAVGNVISGKLGDTLNPTTVLAIGLFGSGACLFLINVAVWINLFPLTWVLGSVSFGAGAFFILAVYFMFGFFQSTGGPVGTAVMGNWFCDKESVSRRGLIFGLWTCHQYCGDVCAQFSAAIVLGTGMPYWWALLIPAVANVAWGFLTMQLIADPANVGIITEEVRIRMEKNAAKAAAGHTVVDEGPKPISFVAAFQIPMVAQYAVAFGFFKLTNYTLFFWLPDFLGKNFDPVAANLIASLYSFGMMPGGIIVGYISDKFGGRRACVIGVFMTLLMFFLTIFSAYQESLSTGALLVMLFIMGILVGGPNNIITSAVAADLASHPSVRGSNKSLGTVTGLINGTGSVTAAIGLNFIGPLADKYGQWAVWLYLVGCTFVGTSLMVPKILGELFPPAPVETREIEELIV